MNNEDTLQWLSTHKTRLLIQWAAGAFFGLLLSLALLAFAWGFVYAVCVLIFQSWPVSFVNKVAFITATTSIPCLFVGSMLVRQEKLSPEKDCVTTGTVTDEIISDGFGHSNINPIAPNTVITIVKVLLDFLFCGPRLVFGSFRLVVRIMRLVKLDVLGCATIITHLYNSNRRLSYEDLLPVTGVAEHKRVLQDLKLLDAVLSLQSQPQGLVLRSEFRQTLDNSHNQRRHGTR